MSRRPMNIWSIGTIGNVVGKTLRWAADQADTPVFAELHTTPEGVTTFIAMPGDQRFEITVREIK